MGGLVTGRRGHPVVTWLNGGVIGARVRDAECLLTECDAGGEAVDLLDDLIDSGER